MTDTEFQGIFEAYLDAFAATSPAEQERLLRSSAAEDVVYTNPGVEGRGLLNLLKHISVFQERFPAPPLPSQLVPATTWTTAGGMDAGR